VNQATLSQRILDVQDQLTRTERRLATLLLENPEAVALQSASELAQKAGVSKATTARFFQRLGYPSFKTARSAVRDAPAGSRATDQKPHPDDKAVPLGLAEHLAADVQNLIRTIEQLRSDEVDVAVRMLARAEKLWVVGFGENYPLAHFARALLIRVKADIRMIPIGGFSIPEEFASITDADTMLAFGLGRRTRGLRSIMRSAVAAGAQVIYVTDQVGRSGPDVAGVTLRCRTHGAGVFASWVAPVSIVTYVCSALAVRIGGTAMERLQAIEQIHSEWGDLIQGDL
jgi:DNA-binding MurR/RpiR family transcriptional regulator